MQNQQTSCSALRRRRRIERKTEPSLSNGNESFLVDDIIIDILSRLPAKDVLRCRCVCSRWRDFTSTRDFTELHRRRSYPMILKDYKGLALLDRCWEPAQTRSKILKMKYQYHNNDLSFSFSHNGFIVSQKRKTSIGVDSYMYDTCIIISNPIYPEVVRISIPLTPCMSVMYGVFFHPVLKEYCTLWLITLSDKPLKVQYRILNLESNPQWRDIKNPCTQNAKLGCTILIDRYLYWMVEPIIEYNSRGNSTFNPEIMEYDIRNEEFRMIPCPQSFNVNLVDIDGVVSLVQVFPWKESVRINIWTLKDHGGQSWTSSCYKVSSDVYIHSRYSLPKAVAFWNGELVIQSDGRLYVCNLKLETSRKFGQQYYHEVKFLSHVTSPVSLRNCKSTICLVEKDEKNQ